MDIDDDVLLAVKSLSRQRHISAGRLLSEMARQTLTATGRKRPERNGVPIFPVQPGAGIVTMELVNRLRDEES
ncbi:MAG: CopG family transcriptional regulator [Lentisphaerota bacterium]